MGGFWTALHLAGANRHVQVVVLLLAAGYNPHMRNSKGLDAWEVTQQLNHVKVLDLRPSAV